MSTAIIQKIQHSCSRKHISNTKIGLRGISKADDSTTDANAKATHPKHQIFDTTNRKKIIE